MSTFTLTPGYVWVDGEVETATKFNLAATPTLGTDQSYTFSVGSSALPSVNFTGFTTAGFYYASGVGVSVGGVSVALFAATGPTFGTDTATGYTTANLNGASGGAIQFKKASVSYGIVYGDNTNTVFDSGASTNIILAVGGVTKGLLNSTGMSVTGTFSVSGNFGVNGAGAIAKPTVTGSKGANAALTSLLTALASYGLLTDSST